MAYHRRPPPSSMPFPNTDPSSDSAVPRCSTQAFKFRPDGSLDRCQARLVAFGNWQEYGIDYEETFAPVAKMTTVRTILALAASQGWSLQQMDCLLFILLKVKCYSSLFLRKTFGGIVLLLVYVDDIVITGSDIELIKQLQQHLKASFHTKYLGPLQYFLGIEVQLTPIVAIRRITQYLKGTSTCGLFFPKESSLQLVGYSDADWAECADTHHSITGRCMLLGNALISWKSKKQDRGSKSSIEYEYRAMSSACSEITWLRGLLGKLGFSQLHSTPLHADNTSAIQIAANHVFHEQDTEMLVSQQKSNGEVARLMAFKRSSVAADPSHFLGNWIASSTSPCTWQGITCSSRGRVTAINLNNAGLSGHLHLIHLLALPFLHYLNLHGNSFSNGGDPLAFMNSSHAPCSLENLDLSSNNLSDPLDRPSFSLLLSCNQLSSLNLSCNSIPGGSLDFSPSLLQLDLSQNQISDSAILTYSLSNCQNLNLLNLSNNRLPGELRVTSFDLVANSLPSINYLDLSHNNFSGDFSRLEFGDCAKLMLLGLSHNSLSGAGFPTSLTNCQLLETLDLSYNDLQYKIPGVLLGNLKNLRRLSLAHNQLSGVIPHELGLTCQTLVELDLHANRLSGGLPSTFTSCSSLRSLNLGKNMLSGDFLDTVISTLPSLRYLYVYFNNITALVPVSLANCIQLQVLDLSSNAFFGNIPYGFCSSPSSNYSSSALEKILLPNNFLSGSVLLELAKCKNLRTVDLSLNKISGPIPSGIWSLPNLSNLIMWANNLEGVLPNSICFNGGNLETLILNNNLITGTIPPSLGNCTNLMWLSLSSNQLTGEIPASIGNLPYLTILQLNNNMLTGQIPLELSKCQSLIWLELNSNNISGHIPSKLASQASFKPRLISGKKFAFMRNDAGITCRGTGGLIEFRGIRAETVVSLPMIRSCPISTRIYSDQTIFSFKSNSSMLYLDLSSNFLSGTIPESFGSIIHLQVLKLGYNRLTGNIPNSFGNFKDVAVLDLSHNNLQGFIPGSLETLSFLSFFDVSNNRLTGPIPSGGQLITFPSSNYENNSGLCGLPLPPCGSSLCGFTSSMKCGSADQQDFNPKLEISSIDWKAAVAGYGCGMIIGVFVGNCIIQRKEKRLVKIFRWVKTIKRKHGGRQDSGPGTCN
ncbi:receptor-like protein kinase BRI1-like 3 [Malania oleifera]|uniref:receptor-like protein kinase BRI1-like 3 n=1 Tax=Malania oleifera TaxID=397392 RepID=UPI0025ADB5A7|nr:receptor-like protein kinase BRI1-like 3 [Malania oleifera]